MRSHRVVVLALPPVVGYDLTIPPQIFGTATDEHGRALYDVRVCGLDHSPIPAVPGYSITPEHGPEALAEADTVIIPGTQVKGPRADGTLPPEIAQILGLIPASARIMSICTGAFVLGAAGILDGRPATTHWAHAERFRSLYPNVRVNDDVLFVDDGDVLTSAGLSAGVDLCLHVIRSDHGSEVANRTARYCVAPPWREGGQAQFIERHVPESSTEGTAPTREWVLRHLDKSIDLAAMAAHAQMSVRTFFRKFRAETGSTPGGWLVEQRLRHARHLLETTDLSVDQVAQRAGLGTGATLRQHMRTTLGVAPLAYRKTFRSG